ncbi:hypothetical protein P153DRAFT_300299 [Dothidotthia symphoricarpi CBS 119687]|uniref:Rhodopsin domain-containing protein n=1 Tax=Dothidotthia symphoricarpi CBS 119687 TaxID=1392245 RepID=A0A6A6A1U1_9PLEO|nr:uncharacterized protein P153DRAFT_300299 [Dothidotthia symphoricarpi CBS 119687]KAF2125496.1 hypothetical protein P153DRAFT_300299 [Dothidotthia symphoricarpi CBS 119687]
MHSEDREWFVLSSQATANIRHAALIPAAIFSFLALCVVVLRWCSRIFLRPGYVKTEDYLVTVAMVKYGLGSAHEDQAQNLATFATLFKIIYAQSILYHITINLVKASFVLQYMHLFSVFRPMIYICYALLGFILGAAAWGGFGIIFLCKSVQGSESEPLTDHSSCVDAEMHLWSTSVMGIVLDCAIWVLPIPVVGRLRLPKRQKIGLVVVFGLGIFVCIVSVLRLVLVHRFAEQGKVTKSATYVLIWSTLEVNLSIICASLLVMKPLFARFIPAMVSEQPMSASEDVRQWRQLAGLLWLDGVATEEEKQEDDVERRDTALQMSGVTTGMVERPERTWNPRRSLRSGSPATI